MDKLNADGNLIGRLGALVAIAAAIFVVGRVTGGNEMCPFSGGMKSCCMGAKPAAEAPAQPATPSQK